MTKRIDMQGNKLAQKHGLSHTRLHRIWHSMYCRCYYLSTNQLFVKNTLHLIQNVL